MEISFDKSAAKNQEVEKTVKEFLEGNDTMEKAKGMPVVIFQDGVRKSYYIRCAITGGTMSKIVSLDARLNPKTGETFRDNREILMTHNTFLRMREDAR